MPFDLASLPYGPLSRFKKLSTPFEFGNLKRIGLQHPIVETLPNYTTLEHAFFRFIGPQCIQLSYFLDYVNRERLLLTFTKGSRHAVFLSNQEHRYLPNDEAVDPAIVSQIALQPQRVTIKDFKFNKSSFIFMHPCRKFVRKVILKVSDEYTFTGGEFNLIFETFPVLEELIINKNDPLSDWLDDFIDSNFEKKENFFVQFQMSAFSSIEECRTKLAKVFEKSGSRLTLSLRLERYPPTAARFVSDLQRLGYCITVERSKYESYDRGVYVKIRKDHPQSMVRITYPSPTLFLDDSYPHHVEIQSFEVKPLHDIVKCMHPEDIVIESDRAEHEFDPCLILTNLKKNTQAYGSGIRLVLENIHFETQVLTVDKCDIDNNLLEFMRPFCHHVKTLRLRDIKLSEDISGISLFETFPNIEELLVTKPKSAFYFTDLFKLKSVNIFSCDTTSLWKFLRDNKIKVKELFEQAHSSFYLRLTEFSYPLDAMDKIRRLGFYVKLCNYKIYVYNSIQEHIRKQFDKRLILNLYPHKIKFNSNKITASSPKVEFVVDCITLNTDQPSFKVKSKVRKKLIIQPTIVKVTKCVDDHFFKFAKGFSNSLQHLDLRQCCCKKSHSEMLKERIRNTFPNLVKIWDIADD